MFMFYDSKADLELSSLVRIWTSEGIHTRGGEKEVKKGVDSFQMRRKL